ncbi:Uncharacterised protein [Legionella bozemanae]|uniref:Uncharacterized protein n=1 Tax=Legionella bozemanae TaxID=447 RepID=A0A0W0RSQ6_LEGBO|nr:hypothetical protein Lboz_1521 [Legionella bozemanae]STO33672.1 Uncharacterised protein [Legionella bozemanae]
MQLILKGFVASTSINTPGLKNRIWDIINGLLSKFYWGGDVLVDAVLESDGYTAVCASFLLALFSSQRV